MFFNEDGSLEIKDSDGFAATYKSNPLLKAIKPVMHFTNDSQIIIADDISSGNRYVLQSKCRSNGPFTLKIMDGKLYVSDDFIAYPVLDVPISNNSESEMKELSANESGDKKDPVDASGDEEDLVDESSDEEDLVDEFSEKEEKEPATDKYGEKEASVDESEKDEPSTTKKIYDIPAKELNLFDFSKILGLSKMPSLESFNATMNVSFFCPTTEKIRKAEINVKVLVD